MDELPVPPAFLFTGDRNWSDGYIVNLLMMGFMVMEKRDREKLVIVHGDASGLDSLAKKYGNQEGLEVRDYPADWDRYGRRAGPIRNQEMLDGEYVKIGFAFHDSIAESKGTKDMVRRILKDRHLCYIIKHATEEDVK